MNAPNGIQQLRNLVLDLATVGKLVENSSEVNEFRNLESMESHWDIPHNWIWAKLSDLVEYSSGKTPKTKQPDYWAENGEGVPWLSIGDMVHRGVTNISAKSVSQKAINEVMKREPVSAGTILMSFKLTIGKITRPAMDTYHNEAIISIHSLGVSEDYLFHVLPSLANLGNKVSAIKGKTLNKKSLGELLLPVPPLSEQERIVARVDELMKFCDRLEEQQQAAKAFSDELRVSTFHHMVQSEKPEDAHDALQILFKESGLLLKKPEDVEDVRKLVLRMAVRGELSESDISDKSAMTILKEADLERKKKKLSKDQEAFKRFSIPAQWEVFGR